MTEFNNRISAQREILKAVNALHWREELFGLAGMAIDRWMLSNQIDSTSRLAMLVREAGAKLFFLANRSQEQITSDYKILSAEVESILQKITSESKLLKKSNNSLQ